MDAVRLAQSALVAGEEGALPALRQSLVDLASSAELCVEELDTEAEPSPASSDYSRLHIQRVDDLNE
jgi:hypothetical protein